MYVYDSPRIGAWICEKAGGEYAQGNTCFGIEQDGKLVVGVNFYGYTGEGGTIYMGSRVENPKLTTRFFYAMIFDYAFNVAKVKRATCIVEASNTHAIRVDEKLGFKCEARLESYFPKGDALVFRMFRDECRFLGEKYALVSTIQHL
jgi:RimJ/RimL family protein N-acetyltransferase